MKRDTIAEIAVFIMLIAVGVAARLTSNSLEIYNFASVSAIAIFAGFYLRSTVVAALVPLTIMIVSNQFLLPYNDNRLLVGMYALLMAPVLFRFWLRRDLSALSVGLCAAGTTLFYFVGSNFVHWLCEYKEYTLANFTECYVAALPFLKWTLLGDLVFSAMLFGSYAFAARYGYIPAVKLQKKLVTADRS